MTQTGPTGLGPIYEISGMFLRSMCTASLSWARWGEIGMGMAAAPRSGRIMNDIGPVVETDGLDFIIDYIKVDRPHDDWDAAVVTIQNIPNLAFQDEGIWLKMAENTFRRCGNGSCVSTGTSISRNRCWRRLRNPQYVAALPRA